MTFAAALGCGLVGGIFFAFSSFVMKALARLRPEQGIAAMQSINIVVINPGFFAAFLGTGVVCLVLAALALTRDSPDRAWILAGSLLYLIGTIGVTMVGNVPRNNALAGVDPAAAGSVRVWTDYVASWTAWNHVRTIAALAAALTFTIALRSR